MPGISLVCDLDESLTVVKDSLVQALGKSIHSNEYHTRDSLVHSLLLPGVHSLRGIPGIGFENDRFHIVVEGEIYGKSQTALQAELLGLAESIFDTELEKRRSAQWLRITDGEFVLLFLISIPIELLWSTTSSVDFLSTAFHRGDGLLFPERWGF